MVMVVVVVVVVVVVGDGNVDMGAGVDIGVGAGASIGARGWMRCIAVMAGDGGPAAASSSAGSPREPSYLRGWPSNCMFGDQSRFLLFIARVM